MNIFKRSIKAKITEQVVVTGDSGYLLKITQGELPGPNGELFTKGDHMHCFHVSPKEGDYCAYFDKNAQIESGSECELGPYSQKLASQYTALPLRIVHSKPKVLFTNVPFAPTTNVLNGKKVYLMDVDRIKAFSLFYDNRELEQYWEKLSDLMWSLMSQCNKGIIEKIMSSEKDLPVSVIKLGNLTDLKSLDERIDEFLIGNGISHSNVHQMIQIYSLKFKNPSGQLSSSINLLLVFFLEVFPNEEPVKQPVNMNEDWVFEPM